MHVKCPVEVCVQRDPKSLYQKALAGGISNFTSVSDPYKEPLNPEVLIENDKEAIDIDKVLYQVKFFRITEFLEAKES